MKLPENESAESVLRKLDEQHSKYKFMEYNLNTKKNRLEHWWSKNMTWQYDIYHVYIKTLTSINSYNIGTMVSD